MRLLWKCISRGKGDQVLPRSWPSQCLRAEGQLVSWGMAEPVVKMSKCFGPEWQIAAVPSPSVSPAAWASFIGVPGHSQGPDTKGLCLGTSGTRSFPTGQCCHSYCYMCLIPTL